MIKNLMYIELKSGYSDDGPAWIGFQKAIGGSSNYIDVENGDRYWITGLKKDESNRHWAGHGKITIDRRAVEEYLALVGEKELPSSLFEVADMEDKFPVERANRLLNGIK